MVISKGGEILFLNYVLLFLVILWVVIFILFLLRMRYLRKQRHKKHYRRRNTIQKTVQIPKIGLEISNLQNQGTRDYQEDSFGISNISYSDKGILAILADGMGGMAAGKESSETAVQAALDFFDNVDIIDDPVRFLLDTAVYTNKRVSSLPELQQKDGGTTLILCYIRDYDMYYLSIGDSRICLCRNNEIIKLNKEHILAYSLDEMVRLGEIDEEEAMNNPMRNALTSYVGAEEIPKIDYCKSAISLLHNDKIILMSDGVFGSISDKEILEALGAYDLNTAARLIEHCVLSKKKKNQDNFTAVIIAKN